MEEKGKKLFYPRRQTFFAFAKGSVIATSGYGLETGEKGIVVSGEEVKPRNRQGESNYEKRYLKTKFLCALTLCFTARLTLGLSFSVRAFVGSIDGENTVYAKALTVFTFKKQTSLPRLCLR